MKIHTMKRLIRIIDFNLKNKKLELKTQEEILDNLQEELQNNILNAAKEKYFLERHPNPSFDYSSFFNHNQNKIAELNKRIANCKSSIDSIIEALKNSMIKKKQYEHIIAKAL